MTFLEFSSVSNIYMKYLVIMFAICDKPMLTKDVNKY